MFMSLTVSEKKATSDPETKKDSKKRMIMVKKRMVEAAGVIARKSSRV